MVRNVDYEARKKIVLAKTINRYIKAAQPVASNDIANDFSLSSATIRNIFADLEREGYLTHPYTSGGRIPTDKGYRYYVDYLIKQIELLDEEKKSIVDEYKNEICRLENILEKTSRIISSITHYASIVSLLDWHDKFFYRGLNFILDQPEFRDFDRIRFLIKMIEEKQQLLHIINRDFKEKVKVYIGDELGCSEMKNCAMVISRYSVNKKPQGRLAVLGPARMDYDHTISILQFISDFLSDILDEI